MIKKILSLLVIINLLCCSLNLLASDDQEKQKLPSGLLAEIKEEISKQREKGGLKTYEEREAARAELARKKLLGYNPTDLPKEEKLNLGELYTTAGDKDEARKIYSEVATGSDMDAREATKRLMYLDMDNLEENHLKLEKTIAEYRSKFPPSPEDLFGIYSPVSSLSKHYYDKGDPQKSIEIVRAEVAYVNTDEPYWSFRLLPSKWYAFVDLGKKQEFIEEMKQYKSTFEKIAAARNESIPENEEEAASYNRKTKGFESLARSMQAGITKATIFNAEAPKINFTHFFNTEPISWEDLKGKVVVMDFWATWCGPCIVTFPQLRELHDRYEGKPVVMLGVTGFQGSMSNHGKPRVTEITQEEELKLMPEFLEYQNVTWPIVFSERNCYDPEYGIEGVPTTVVIDKEGKVRMFDHPYYLERISAMIDKLLQE